ncbi:hypothetical protein [Pedobacter metabolipauper]|uniref:Uncharacterized protein n=1 Tax=Pedobacter metabolipauper TaxID=425513 RepID=A0A4R6T364_9SPHI|nr:hypothetical protein [Pedobacter metabolipauper]TDQ12188.1 hypothetical protein ATK78_1322 [Pedobacter metabolipauper]
MAKQIKPKYPSEREKTSQAFSNAEVSTDVMTTHPRVIITIGGSLSNHIINDIQNAIDDVLNHHGK